MKDYSKIDIDDNRAIFDRGRVSNSVSNDTSVLVLLVIVFIVSVCVFILEFYDNQYIKTIRSMSRIKNNLNSTAKVVETAHKNFVNRVNIVQTIKNGSNLTELDCHDMGTYYVAMKIDPETGTFVGIRRGKGGLHTVQKVAANDAAALDFCRFLILTEDQRQKIGCGRDMFEKLGYSDLLNNNSPCNQIIEAVYEEK